MEKETKENLKENYIEMFICKKINDVVFLENFSKNNQKIFIESGVQPVRGNIITIKENKNILQLEITNVKSFDLNKYEIIVDSPADNDFTIECIAEIGEKNLNLDGSVTLETAEFLMNGLDEEIIAEIESIKILIEDKDESLITSFGGRNKLSNGLVARVAGEENKNIFNIKQNKDFVLNSFKMHYPPKNLCKNYTLFAIKNDIDIEMKKNNSLEIIIQDDLTKIDNLNIRITAKIR